ncbi:hypothetical protein BDZ94DRAFT_1040410 [Collybia nuda]|uniref:Uncharacterized protein n=1 Tax=Collybia nuda TaxID=64659 RepID=A0A9P5YGZ7_9AGAR|nr:hypothetical protein BDZ94DRAFT_1040410 [Collybia nuda]
MAKGTPYEISIGVDSIGSTERPEPSSKLSPPQVVNTSRSSVLSSVVPYLRRLDIGDDMFGHQKVPLLTLRLSSPSFLDSFVNDDITKDPLYIIKTVGTSTTIRRADPWVGNTKTADIDWPQNAPAKGKGVSDGILIQMRGARWKGGETLLRRSTMRTGPRKFNIPNYAHNLKWRRVGASYWCTTSAVKGPIAILDPAIENLPPRMCVFETLHDKYDLRPMLVHHGVSLLLLDYLLVTALLLVTDVQDWMLVKKFEGRDSELSPLEGDGAAALKSGLGHVSTSNLQWRKIMFGEPLFPKRSSRSSMSSTSDIVPRTPTSSEQMAKIVYGDPLYPTLSIRSTSPDISSSESDNEDDHMFFSPALTRPPSPSAESVYYPSSAPTAPPHTHLDPSFYIEHDIPPVPPIPAQYGTPGAGSSRGSSSRPSSSHSTASTRRLRELPIPPIPALVPRPRSTPPRSMTSPGTSEERAVISIAHHSLPASRRLPDPSTRSFTSPSTSQPRQLPRPPSPSDSDGYNLQRQAPLGRSRSQSVRSGEKWNSQHGPRSLPAPPTGSSASSNNVQDRRRRRRQTLKDPDDDLTRWITHPREYAPAPLSQTTFDTPPPAYNSIDFQTVIDLPNIPSLPPTIPQSVTSSTGQ